MSDDDKIAGEDCTSCIIPGAKVFLPLRELIDVEKEIARLTKELETIESELARVRGKLSNEGFVAKAPEKLIASEKEKQAKYEALKVETEAQLKKVKEL